MAAEIPWIETAAAAASSEYSQHLQQDQNADNVEEEEEEGVASLFADPDPYDTFVVTLHLPLGRNNEGDTHGSDDDRNSNYSGNNDDNPLNTNNNNNNTHNDLTTAPTTRPLHITLHGYKAELGQTLSSTGLTLWRASHTLSHWILHSREVRGKLILELGAGLGLNSIAAYHRGALSVYATDGDSATLAYLRRNVAQNCCEHVNFIQTDTDATVIMKSHSHVTPPPPLSSRTIECHQLIWGHALSDFQSTHGVFDVIMGADIIYLVDQLPPLWATVDALLTQYGMFVLAYARRNVSMDRVLEHARRHHFVLQSEPAEGTEGVYIFTRSVES
jgi:predicted nicotinamide N-methyase